MLNRVVGKSYRRLTLIPCFPFGLGNLLLHYIRTLMNRVRWEENRELRALETRSNNLPRSTEQANKLFVATEQSISLSEEARLQRIDQVHALPCRSSALGRIINKSSHIKRDWIQITSWTLKSSRSNIERRIEPHWIGSIPNPTYGYATKTKRNTIPSSHNCVNLCQLRHLPQTRSSQLLFRR